MLLVVSGRWHKTLPNEPPVTPGWELAFSLVAGKRVEGEHCSMLLAYKPVRFEDFATDEMVEAASRLDIERCIELAMEKFLQAPEELVELDSFPHQVAAAAVLSTHKIVKALIRGESATFSKPLRLTPLEILRAVYSKPEGGALELRLNAGPATWSMIKASASLQGFKPEDGLALLNGDEAKKAELLNLLKVKNSHS